mgnify:CR=1 FL=1
MNDQFCATSLGKLRYWQQGTTGPVIVLIPGLGGSLENWQYNVEELSKHCQVYVVDPIGFGRSDKPDIKYLFEVIANSVKEFLQVMNIEKAHLIGNSLGGAIALKVAHESPGVIDKLVLADSAGFSRHLPFAFRIASVPILGSFLLRPKLEFTRKALESFVYDKETIKEDFVEQMFKLASLPGQKRVILSILREHVNLFGMKRDVFNREFSKIKGITNSILLIWGREDPVIRFADAQIALHNSPHSTLETFEKCGHLPQIEMPHKFNQSVINFIIGKPN